MTPDCPAPDGASAVQPLLLTLGGHPGKGRREIVGPRSPGCLMLDNVF